MRSLALSLGRSFISCLSLCYWPLSPTICTSARLHCPRPHPWMLVPLFLTLVPHTRASYYLIFTYDAHTLASSYCPLNLAARPLILALARIRCPGAVAGLAVVLCLVPSLAIFSPEFYHPHYHFIYSSPFIFLRAPMLQCRSLTCPCLPWNWIGLPTSHPCCWPCLALATRD